MNITLNSRPVSPKPTQHLHLNFHLESQRWSVPRDPRLSSRPAAPTASSSQRTATSPLRRVRSPNLVVILVSSLSLRHHIPSIIKSWSSPFKYDQNHLYPCLLGHSFLPRPPTFSVIASLPPLPALCNRAARAILFHLKSQNAACRLRRLRCSSASRLLQRKGRIHHTAGEILTASQISLSPHLSPRSLRSHSTGLVIL